MNFSARFKPNLLPGLRDQYRLAMRLLVDERWDTIRAYVKALEERVKELERAKNDLVS